MAIHRILNQAYAEGYSEDFSKKLCEEYFTHKQYMSGQEIIQLTQSRQLNLMLIKILFDNWQQQLEAMAQNPYFDFRDHNVGEALTQFMNALSRAIKIQKADFEPLLSKAVKLTLQLGADPVSYFKQEWAGEAAKPPGYFKDLEKYIKWHVNVWRPVAASLEDHREGSGWVQELEDAFENNRSTLASAENLLKPLDEQMPIDWEQFWTQKTVAPWEEDTQESISDVEDNSAEDEQPEDESISKEGSDEPMNDGLTEIDPALAWAKFEAEEYTYMKGSIGHLREGMGINQRIMFTKRLFQGNQDLLDQTMDELNAADSFFDAVNLLNQSFVHTLNWDVQSEEVQELLQLVFRKFDGEED
ncbi:hypothetical protein [Cyclobacterium plantarum]|uniref:Uncharacterized protein n=1 Tax=Cyclobacterium plantarum TaxID=2716263 RepID=A0ABX0HAL6_9BACT|nr:hypothetical protein [Cyclobacterium plantarum]NHE58896.1 hypothetical protein [Cyclobacterium plantarum]